jgi:hypothetical protein
MDSVVVAAAGYLALCLRGRREIIRAGDISAIRERTECFGTVIHLGENRTLLTDIGVDEMLEAFAAARGGLHETA